jgi:hypothetical protein
MWRYRVLQYCSAEEILIMINQFLKGFVDAIYGTCRVRRKFEFNNPSEPVLAADASKSIITNKNQDIQRGLDWANSQRAIVILTQKKIICGNWTIPLETISTDQLIKINSLFGGGQVLKIQTKDNKNYQFGMQINPEWIKQQFLPLTLEKGKIKHSVFSIIMWLIGAIYFIGFINNFWPAKIIIRRKTGFA